MNGVSVVICCFNSENRIKQVLDHLAVQKIDGSVKWEIVLVDNASTDSTAETARSWWSHDSVPLRIVPEPKPGLSNARRTGLKEAKYDFISFVDDDNWVEVQWVQKVYHHFERNPRIGLLGGYGEAVIEGIKPFWFDRLQMCYAVGPQSEESGLHLRNLYGAGLTIRKQAWEHLMKNDFSFILSGRSGSSITSGDDSELCLAVKLAGYELYYDSELRFYHFMPQGRLNWPYLIKLIESFGRTDPVLNLYSNYIQKGNRFRRLMFENRWMVIIRSLYFFIHNLPGYIRVMFFRKEGRIEYVRFKRTKSRLLESFRLFPVYREMVRDLETASWRQR